MTNINDTFFEGYYKEIWRSMIPDELTVKEVDFMLPYFNLKQGDKVLDLMCGYGRHAIGLARKGMNVTAIDNLEYYISEINETAGKESLPLKAIQHNVVSYKIDGFFDLVICMGNSINFFNAEDTTRIFSNIAAHLKPGAHLLLNSWSVAEIAFKNFKERSWSKIGDLKFLTESKIVFHPTRMESESTIIAPGGNTEVKAGIDYIYSLNEMEAMLRSAGLLLQEIYSIPGKKKFTIDEPRAYIIAVKE